MKAVVLTAIGAPDVLQVQEWPDPQVGPGDVRIAVRAAGLNFADTMARAGFYPDAPKPPCVLGYEVAGEVDAVGTGVEGVAVGQRVIAPSRFGGQAELVTVKASSVLPLPEHLSFEQGAAFCVNYATAYAALIIMGGLRAGNQVLIHAAAGGVGIAATQIARNTGAEIFGTASRAKHEAIAPRGPTRYRLSGRRLRCGGATAHRRCGCGCDHRPDGPDIISQGLPNPATGRTADHVRTLRSYGPGREKHEESGPSLLRLPTATMPWWNGARLLNQNRGVFGLNLLSWWEARRWDLRDHRAADQRAQGGTPRAFGRGGFSLLRRRGGAPLSRRAAQHRQSRTGAVLTGVVGGLSALSP